MSPFQDLVLEGYMVFLSKDLEYIGKLSTLADPFKSALLFALFELLINFRKFIFTIRWFLHINA
jgi:hypothetical protein